MSAGWAQDPPSIHAVPTYAKVGATPRRAPAGTVEHPLPLIIDSDPGLDDAIAIGLAVARPELDVLAVTTVGGNADVRHCTDNALRVLDAFGRPDIPVAEGAAGPLTGEVVRATEVHGETGIGDTQLPPSTSQASPEHAVDLMARSTAAVVHGGHSSLIEGLLCATPLVFVPASAEQRGNAARVAALGLGAVVAEDDPVEAVAETIRAALEADRAAHTGFANVLRAADGAGAMLDAVERAVALRRATGGADAR